MEFKVPTQATTGGMHHVAWTLTADSVVRCYVDGRLVPDTAE